MTNMKHVPSENVELGNGLVEKAVRMEDMLTNKGCARDLFRKIYYISILQLYSLSSPNLDGKVVSNIIVKQIL